MKVCGAEGLWSGEWPRMEELEMTNEKLMERAKRALEHLRCAEEIGLRLAE